jgi:lipoate-protein ligase A
VRFFVLQSGANPSAYNMALDEALLEALPRLRTPVLRFYSWTERAASFGYFQ